MPLGAQPWSLLKEDHILCKKGEFTVNSFNDVKKYVKTVVFRVPVFTVRVILGKLIHLSGWYLQRGKIRSRDKRGE